MGHQIRFNCTTEEHDKIKRRAEKVGLTIKNYLLYIALNTEIKISMKPVNIEEVMEGNKFHKAL